MQKRSVGVAEASGEVIEFRLGELFCGPGGIGRGAQDARVAVDGGPTFVVRHVWANDYDKASCVTYSKNIEIPEDRVFPEPVDRFIERLPELERIDALTFGFPCNDFSNIGEKKGLGGKFGPLYEYGAHALDELRPDWFLAENVSGLSNSNAGSAFEKILNRLRNAGGGYNLTVHLYRFEEYGVPQTRHRIVIVGIREDLGLVFRVPAPTHGPNNWVTAGQAIGAHPPASSLHNSEETRQSATVIKRLNKIKPGQNAWNANLPTELQLNVKGARLSNIYRRLRKDAPAYTVTGSGGGGTHIYHWDEPRALTNRERARLQSFPDDHVFYGRKEEVRKQIGMAVPPRAAKVIIEAVLKTFAGIEYPTVPAHWGEFSSDK